MYTDFVIEGAYELTASRWAALYSRCKQTLIFKTLTLFVRIFFLVSLLSYTLCTRLTCTSLSNVSVPVDRRLCCWRIDFIFCSLVCVPFSLPLRDEVIDATEDDRMASCWVPDVLTGIFWSPLVRVVVLRITLEVWTVLSPDLLWAVRNTSLDSWDAEAICDLVWWYTDTFRSSTAPLLSPGSGKLSGSSGSRAPLTNSRAPRTKEYILPSATLTLNPPCQTHHGKYAPKFLLWFYIFRRSCHVMLPAGFELAKTLLTSWPFLNILREFEIHQNWFGHRQAATTTTPF